MEFSGKCCVAKNFGNFCFRKYNVYLYSTPFFAFRKKISEGALEWKGAQILEYTPPNLTVVLFAFNARNNPYLAGTRVYK